MGTYSIIYNKDDELFYAVDWNWQKEGQWTRSSRAKEGGHPWQYHGELDYEGYIGILKHFGLENKKQSYSLKKIEKMSPAKLAKISGNDPLPDTLGENKRASEYN